MGNYKSPFSNSNNNGTAEFELLGGTDQTVIGNVGDRLKVDAQISAVVNVPSIVNFYFDDMNVANGGVAREANITTSYSTVYNKTSTSGNLFSFAITFEGNLIGADPFTVKLTLDNITRFEVTTLDIGTAALYNQDDVTSALLTGLQVNGNTFVFKAPANLGISFSSSIKIEIKKTSGGAKKFRAGFVTIERT